jgi:CHAT domain-containing protein
MSVRGRTTCVAVSAFVLAVCVAGCSRPDAAKAFAEAEQLHSEYEEKASQNAIVRYREALVEWKRQGKTRDAVKANQRIGATYEQLGALGESRRSYLETLSLTQKLSDRLLESEVRSDVGVAHSRLGEFDSALPECQKALELAQQERGARETALALICVGEVDYYRGNSKEAIPLYRKAEQLWETVGDRRGQAETQLLLGSAHADLNELERASQHLNAALALWTELGGKRGQALTEFALVRLQYFPGKYQEALNRLTWLKERFRAAGDAVWQAACLSNTGYVYEQMGEGRRALGYWEEASRLFESAGLQIAALEMFIKIGTAHLGTDVAAALSWFDKARVLSEASGNRHMQSWALRYIGVAYIAQRDTANALRNLERSLDIQRSVEDPLFRAGTLADLGRAYELSGDRDRATKFFKEALVLSQTAGDRVGESRAQFALARASAAGGQLDAARGHIESALRVAESLRTDVEDRELRASYFASVHQYHEVYVDVLMQLRKLQSREQLAAAAFEASERARARSLLDSLSEAHVDLRSGVDPDLLKREQQLKVAFAEWAQRQREMLGAPARDADLKALAANHRQLEDRYNQVQAEIRSRSPRYAALAKPQPLSLRDVQKQVLDRDTLLLEYALGDRRSYLWVVSNADHSTYELAPRAEIEQAAQKLYAQLTARLTASGDARARRRLAEAADAQYWREAARLSELLLAPAAKKLIGKRLLVVADGALQYLPFAALPIPGKQGDPVPMLVEHEIISLPSASALAVLRRENRDSKPSAAVAVLADPVFEADDPRLRAGNGAGRDAAKAAAIPPVAANADAGLELALRDFGFMRDGKLSVPRLAATRHEADAIVGAAPAGTTLRAIDFDANRATAMSPELAKYRVVHFATHGVFNSDDTALSGLILSMFDKRGQPQDGFLRLHDIYGMHLPVELVVLSACNTALGKPVKGEGLVGIVRGFMYAGASRVIASLWKVDDDATGAMMGRFYEEMLTNNRSPAAALRQAQLAMWQQERWRPPFYWAAFALQGEWK